MNALKGPFEPQLDFVWRNGRCTLLRIQLSFW